VINKAILVGRLGQDPELKYTQSGTAVCNFSMATGRKRKSGDGKEYDTTQWHRIVVWKEAAVACGEYLQRGSKVYVEGEIRHRKYEDKDGIERSTTEIFARQVQFLDSKGEGGGKKEVNKAPSVDDEDIPF
jgi:single-strand DNA-binding protein